MCASSTLMCGCSTILYRKTYLILDHVPATLPIITISRIAWKHSLNFIGVLLHYIPYLDDFLCVPIIMHHVLSIHPNDVQPFE